MASRTSSTPESPENQLKKTRPVVLVVHADVAFVARCRKTLEKQGFDVDGATEGTEGIQKIYHIIPDVVLAGSSTPELNGYQLCRLLKNDPVMRKIPLLLVAEVGQKMDHFWAMKAGADDYINKDEVETRLLRKLQTLLEIYDRMDIEEKHLLRANNEKNPFNIRTRLNQILDTALVESMLMVEFRSLSDLVHDTALLNYMLFSLLESIMEYDAAVIFYHDDTRGPRLATLHLPGNRSLSMPQAEATREDFFRRLKDRGISPAQWEVQSLEVIGALDEQAPPVAFETVHLKEVRLDSRLIGAVAFYSRQKVDYAQIFPVHLIEDEIRLLMKLRHLYSQAENYAITDTATGLYNHRHFVSLMQREFKAATRYEHPLSFAVLGLDHFRELNDRWGHAAGDEALRHVAGLLEDSLRSVDILSRFNGKYLGVLMPQTDQAQALRALERFRAQVAASPFQHRETEISLTVSGGLADRQEGMTTLSAMIKLAEDGLRRAREKGRNRIEISPA